MGVEIGVGVTWMAVFIAQTQHTVDIVEVWPTASRPCPGRARTRSHDGRSNCRPFADCRPLAPSGVQGIGSARIHVLLSLCEKKYLKQNYSNSKVKAYSLKT